MTPEALGALSPGELVDLVVALLARVDALEAENKALRAEVAALKAEAGKNSGNSSKPPSRDPAAERARQAEERRAKRERAAGGKRRRPGKQPGSSGNTLAMTDSPDEVVTHAPVVCEGCGADLADAPVSGEVCRQVVELPEVTPKTTEHRAQTRTCACCGTAKHGICAAHLVRDLASVATIATQATWATGLAGLLVEVNAACETARTAGHKKLAPSLQRAFTARYDALVGHGLSANPDPPAGSKRDYLQRRSYNLAVAFATHKKPILAYMRNLDVAFTNYADVVIMPTLAVWASRGGRLAVLSSA